MVPMILFCNSQGVLSYLQKLQWNGETGFTNKDNQISWIYDNKEVGYIIWERNISFINIYNSSHMAYDLPDVSRALIDLITVNMMKRMLMAKIICDVPIRIEKGK